MSETSRGEVNPTLDRLRGDLDLRTPWRYLGRAVTLTFPVANTKREVLHGVGEIPDGYMVLSADAHVRRTPGVQWTKDLAYLQADQANAVVTVVFGVFREEAVNVNAT